MPTDIEKLAGQLNALNERDPPRRALEKRPTLP
jgi:hypothetical protein